MEERRPTIANNDPVSDSAGSNVGAPLRYSSEEGARVRVRGGLPLQLTSVQRQQGPFSTAKGRRNNTFREDKWREFISLPLSPLLSPSKDGSLSNYAHWRMHETIASERAAC